MTINDVIIMDANNIHYNCGRIDGLCSALRRVKHVNGDMKKQLIATLENISCSITNSAEGMVNCVLPKPTCDTCNCTDEVVDIDD